AALERKRAEDEQRRANLFQLQAAEEKRLDDARKRQDEQRLEEQRVAALQQRADPQQRIERQKRPEEQSIQETCDREQAKFDQFKGSQAGGVDIRADLKKFEIETSCSSLRPVVADMIA